jgi:aspartyl-tRNA(Asn)/glutamyl-tRNA(Gln) amidotransferase subunit C
MLGAPSEVTELQLYEANISVRGQGGDIYGSGSGGAARPAAREAAAKFDSLEEVNALTLTEEERAAMDRIFEAMSLREEAFSRVDTGGIEPMIHVLPMTNILRADQRSQPFAREALLQGAPQRTADSWQVPRVVK